MMMPIFLEDLHVSHLVLKLAPTLASGVVNNNYHWHVFFLLFLFTADGLDPRGWQHLWFLLHSYFISHLGVYIKRCGGSLVLTRWLNQVLSIAPSSGPRCDNKTTFCLLKVCIGSLRWCPEGLSTDYLHPASNEKKEKSTRYFWWFENVTPADYSRSFVTQLDVIIYDGNSFSKRPWKVVRSTGRMNILNFSFVTSCWNIFLT